MVALVFNTRRPIFADIRVREAIADLFDFEWINKNFFYSRYSRTASYFEGSELAARGRRMPSSALCWRRFRVPCGPMSSTAPTPRGGSRRDRETGRSIAC
jgi:peptide/nickel transport system substrate-binding protein